MARVKQEVIEQAKDMIDSLPAEHVNTCGLCSRTLFDELTVISVKTGVPEKTITKVFADKYNQGKREEDQVTPNAFNERMKYIRKVNKLELKSESHPINTEEDNVEVPAVDDTEDSAGIVHVIPQELTQPVLVDSLCEFFSTKLKGSDVIYRTLLRVMDRMYPLEASRMRRGEKIQFEDLNKAISHGIKTGDKYSLRDVADQILEGLTESHMTKASVEQIVTMMGEEVQGG